MLVASRLEIIRFCMTSTIQQYRKKENVEYCIIPESKAGFSNKKLRKVRHCKSGWPTYSKVHNSTSQFMEEGCGRPEHSRTLPVIYEPSIGKWKLHQ